MTKTLVAAGDSFTWGNDLNDCNGHASQMTWSAITARHFNLSYCCLAKPGCSNSTIARRVINYLNKADKSKCLVAVMWTFPTRSEILVNRSTYTEFPDLFELDDENFVSISHQHANSLADNLAMLKNPSTGQIEYFTRQHNKIKNSGLQNYTQSLYNLVDHEYHLLETAKSIVLLQLFLEKHNIPYFFSSCTDQIFELTKTNNSFINSLAVSIEWSNWTTNQGFYDWAKETNQNFLSMNHPDEHAHQKWFEKHYINIPL